MSEPLRKSGIVAVVGRANVGKSTLVNRVIGEKVSIVAPLAQTTRNCIRGILSEERGQLVLLDTPGVHRSKSRLGSMMNRMARGTTDGVDAAVLVFDASVRPRDEDDGWMRRLAHAGYPCIFALNKIDLGGDLADMYHERWISICEEKHLSRQVSWMPVSARQGDGIDKLTGALFSFLPVGEPLFPEEIVSDYPLKLTLADAIRERLVVGLRDEVPHAVAVWVDEVDRGGEAWAIDATVYVEKSSQKGIVIGKKGRNLKRVERESADAIGELYDCTADVKLWVKVEKKWQENFWLLRKLGYA